MSYYDDEKIIGTLNSNSNGILQISTSYTTGWKAFVDGNEFSGQRAALASMMGTTSSKIQEDLTKIIGDISLKK